MNYFADIVGHEKIIGHLQDSIRTGKVSHAYIFEGENGSGKNMLANAFAAALQCEKGGMEACGECHSCRQTFSGNQPDISWVTHDKQKVSVDDIREQLNNQIFIKPYECRYKVYIIDEAEKMTEQAQNALLKTIEEPPEYAVIILLTENKNAFLQTILSRCICLSLRPIDKQHIKKYLMEKLERPDYLAELAASFSSGNLGKAIGYSTSEDFIKVRDDAVHLLKYIQQMDFDEMMDTMHHFSEQKASIEEYLDIMQLWFRDVLLFKATKNANNLLFREEVMDIRKQADIRTFENLGNVEEAFRKIKVRLRANVNFEVAIELLLLSIMDLK